MEFGCQTNECNLLHAVKSEIVGFFVARHIPLNTHLHSFFVKEEYEIPAGRMLMMRHWEGREGYTKAANTYATQVIGAIKFYTQFGYEKLLQSGN